MSKCPPKPKAKAPPKNLGGRPRVFAEFPVYDSMEQCAGATGIPISHLKFAKRQGCLFIRHGRVHIAEFISWFFSQTPENVEDAIDWSKRDKRMSAMIKEIEYEKMRDSVIEWVLVEKFIMQLVGINFFGELERLAGEFPATLKGKSEVEIASEVANEVKSIKESLRSRMEIWKTKKGKINE
jgi:hypothetical protein